MSMHYIKKCRHCSVVLSQCRCPAADKEVQLGECENCEGVTVKVIDKMSTRELRSEVRELRHRVNSLEEGECRFHCRMRKDMWKAGGAFVFEHRGAVQPTDQHLEEMYKQWRKHERNT